MAKRNLLSDKASKIIYWIATLWLALGMASTAIVQFIKTQDEVDLMKHLGYPVYFLTIIGVWKILGVIAILIPKFPLLKEWTYAGFFFVMSGAVISHLIIGDGAKENFGPMLLIILTAASWHFRPAGRRIMPISIPIAIGGTAGESINV